MGRNHIKEDLNSKCPACRRIYTDESVEFRPVSQQELQTIKTQKKLRAKEKKEQEVIQRRQLSNVRVVQKNLVYILGLPLKLAVEEVFASNTLTRQDSKVPGVLWPLWKNSQGCN